MALEKLVCPTCGGNDLKPIGHDLFKCVFCGGTFKDEPDPLPADHKVAPLNTDFKQTYQEEYNTYESDDKDDSSSPGRVVFGVVGLFFIVIALLAVTAKTCNDSQRSSTNTITFNADSFTKAIMPGLYDFQHDSLDLVIPDMSEFASYNENGITVRDVVLLDGTDTVMEFSLKAGEQIDVALLQPKGFRKVKKKISYGYTMNITDKDGNVVYYSDNSEDSTAADASVYKQKIGFSFVASDRCGMKLKKDYKLNYKVWDRNSEASISGRIPLFIEY